MNRVIAQAVKGAPAQVSEIALAQQGRFDHRQSGALRDRLSRHARARHVAAHDRGRRALPEALPHRGRLQQAAFAQRRVRKLQGARGIQGGLAVTDQNQGHVGAPVRSGQLNEQEKRRRIIGHALQAHQGGVRL
jgi:hypothetical protein